MYILLQNFKNSYDYIPSQKWAQANDQISLLRQHQKLKFHWWVHTDIIYRYTEEFLKLLNLAKLLTVKVTQISYLSSYKSHM